MLRAVCLPIAFLVLAPWTLGQDDFKIADADRKKLGRALGDWVEAKMEGDFSAALDANEDLTKALEGVQKKLKGVPALACIADSSSHSVMPGAASCDSRYTPCANATPPTAPSMRKLKTRRLLYSGAMYHFVAQQNISGRPQPETSRR